MRWVVEPCKVGVCEFVSYLVTEGLSRALRRGRSCSCSEVQVVGVHRNARHVVLYFHSFPVDSRVYSLHLLWGGELHEYFSSPAAVVSCYGFPFVNVKSCLCGGHLEWDVVYRRDFFHEGW